MYIDRNEAIKRIRIALKKRTGKPWSITGGRGTAWGWITVQAPPKRRVDHEQSETWDRANPDKSLFTEVAPPPEENGLYTSLEDCKELAKAFALDKPHIHTQGLSISPDSIGYYVYLAENGKKPEPIPPRPPEPIDIIAEAAEIVVKVETETAVTKMITAINTILDKSDPGQALNALIKRLPLTFSPAGASNKIRSGIMSIADESLRVQIDNRIMRPYLSPEDAVHWSNRARELFPTTEVKIIDLDGSKHEAEFSDFEDFEVEVFITEFLADETNQIILRTATTEEIRKEVLTDAEVYFSQVSDNLLDRLCRKVEAAR